MMGVRTGELRPVWPDTTPQPLVKLAQACMAQDPSERPKFEAIMQQLTNIEGDMRMEEYAKRNSSTAGQVGATTSRTRTCVCVACVHVEKNREGREED